MSINSVRTNVQPLVYLDVSKLLKMLREKMEDIKKNPPMSKYRLEEDWNGYDGWITACNACIEEVKKLE